MQRVIEIIRSAVRIASATKKRRLLLAVVLSMIVAIPSYGSIISNQIQHVVTIQDVTITSSPSVDSIQPSGSTEAGTVTVSTPQQFTGRLTLSITNTTAVDSTINPLSFTVTINSVVINGLAGGKTILFVGAPMTSSNGIVINYTVKFLSKADVGGAINGIQSGTLYAISQLVSQVSE